MFNSNINYYGICLILAIMVNIIIVWLNSKRFNFDKFEIMALIFYEIIGIFLGGKIGTILTHLNKYSSINFFKVGFSSYGCLVGLLLFIIIFKIQFKVDYKILLYILSPVFPLMYSIGKIGCFLAGCCYGIKYGSFGSIVYNYSISAPKGISLFPIQIVESFIFLIISIYFIRKLLKLKFNDKVLGQLCISCSISKFLLDFLRYSHYDHIISLNQIVSILFLIIGVIIYMKSKNTGYLNFKIDRGA